MPPTLWVGGTVPLCPSCVYDGAHKSLNFSSSYDADVCYPMGMTFDDFVTEALEYARRHREQRFGQACTNALRYVRPELSRTLALPDVWEVTDPRTPIMGVWFTMLEGEWA